jgi:hypothetical protein
MNIWSVLAVALVVAAAVLGVVGFLVGQVSGVLAPLAVFVAFVWLLHRWHSGSQWRRKLREKDDFGLLLSGCRSGVFSRFRRLYRGIPSDPRCRFCLVPFGGVGRVLRFTPSRKNPNFCPG